MSTSLWHIDVLFIVLILAIRNLLTSLLELFTFLIAYLAYKEYLILFYDYQDVFEYPFCLNMWNTEYSYDYCVISYAAFLG